MKPSPKAERIRRQDFILYPSSFILSSMTLLDQLFALQQTRGQFFSRSAAGIGVAALSSLLNRDLFARLPRQASTARGALAQPHFAPKAKQVIYLHQSGAPSHIDLSTTNRRCKRITEWSYPRRFGWANGSLG
jgi:hypothetical protein